MAIQKVSGEGGTMGQAKQRRMAAAASLCVCGSGKLAGHCCFTGTHWHKPPSVLGLRSMSPGGAVGKCYMGELRSCHGRISGEHLITKSILILLQEDADFSISGLPWLEQGETRVISPERLVAKCLCVRHNSALSPLDTAALRLFGAFKSSMNGGGRSEYLVSGHDVERWLLKTLKSLAVSGNLARGRARLSGAFAGDLDVISMLDDPASWPEGTGLYCTMNTGDRIEHDRQRVQLAPCTNAHDELNGLVISIMGLEFTLALTPPQLNEASLLHQGNFRPGYVAVRQPAGESRVMLSWEDGTRHDHGVTIQQALGGWS